jgi:hypothetical protein
MIRSLAVQSKVGRSVLFFQRSVYRKTPLIKITISSRPRCWHSAIVQRDADTGFWPEQQVCKAPFLKYSTIPQSNPLSLVEILTCTLA